MKTVVIKTSLGYNGVAQVTMNNYSWSCVKDVQRVFITSDLESKCRTDYLKTILSNNDQIVFISHLSNGLMKYFRNYKSIFKNKDVDTLYLNVSSATVFVDVIIAKLFGIKRIIIHSHNSSSKNRMVHYFLRFWLSFCSIERIACSTLAGNWMFKNKPFKIINNGIDIKKFSCDKNDIEQPEKIRLLHIGAFVKAKNHMFLLLVFAELLKLSNKYVLTLIGNGPLKSDIIEAAKSLNIYNDIIFINSTYSPETFYCDSDIFLLPSLHEGLPLVLVEAQIAGLYCFASGNITKEVQIGNSIKFLDIDNPSIFAQEINDNSMSVIGSKRVINSDLFDIKKTSKELDMVLYE